VGRCRCLRREVSAADVGRCRCLRREVSAADDVLDGMNRSRRCAVCASPRCGCVVAGRRLMGSGRGVPLAVCTTPAEGADSDAGGGMPSLDRETKRSVLVTSDGGKTNTSPAAKANIRSDDDGDVLAADAVSGLAGAEDKKVLPSPVAVDGRLFLATFQSNSFASRSGDLLSGDEVVCLSCD